MHRNLGRLVRPDNSVKRLHGEAGGALAGVARSLASERHAILTLPISGCGLKVEADDAAPGHHPTRWGVDHDHGGCYQQSGRVDHVAKPIEMAFHGEELLCLHVGSCVEGVTRLPAIASIPRYRHFVGVAQIQHAGIGILRAALDEGSFSLRDWYTQWLPTEDEKISAVLQIGFDRHPGVRGNSGAVRKHKEAGVSKSAWGL